MLRKLPLKFWNVQVTKRTIVVVASCVSGFILVFMALRCWFVGVPAFLPSAWSQQPSRGLLVVLLFLLACACLMRSLLINRDMEKFRDHADCD